LRAHRRAEKNKDKKNKLIRNNKNFKKCGKQSLVVAFCENSIPK
jgi:hypothetical protein